MYINIWTIYDLSLFLSTPFFWKSSPYPRHVISGEGQQVFAFLGYASGPPQILSLGGLAEGGGSNGHANILEKIWKMTFILCMHLVGFR